jgi:hypothetical protein
MKLVYLSPVPWTSFAQRPHKFVEWFHAKFGGAVLWIDPYPTRLPKLMDFRFVNASTRGGPNPPVNLCTPQWLTVICPRALPIEPLAIGRAVNGLLWRETLAAVDRFLANGDCRLVIGKPSELSLQIMDRHPAVPSLYDAMDDFPAFYDGLSRSAMERRQHEVAVRATKISASSTALLARFRVHKEKLFCVLNASSTDSLPPADKLGRSGQDIVGYVGTIGQWFDWKFVAALATASPSTLVRLIGPIYKTPPRSLPPNVELLPACPHPIAMRLMQEFSIGLIPFCRTALTASVDPIKYYEYRALGLPVISTQFGEMALRGDEPGVFLADEFSDLANLTNSAINHRYSALEVEDFRMKNSWDVRFDSSGVLA